jgi:predicted anti-sigma-YlaC factor YlaD
VNEHPTVNELAAFFSGTLPSERSRQVDSHLDNCDVCRALTDKRPPVPIAPRVGESHPAMPEGYKFVEEASK